MTGIVDSCPKNLTETLIASAGLGCGQDKYGNNQYLCLPNSKKTGLVEFCHDGVMGILERGYCLETIGDKLSETNCSHFLMGCPDTEVHINEMYRYPACLRINTEYQCYLADPSCGNTALDTTTKDTAETFVTQGFSTDNGVYNITETIIQTTTLSDDNSALIGAIVGSLVVVLVAILLLLTVFIVLRRRKLRLEKLGKAEEDEKKVLLEPLTTMDNRQGSRVNDTQEPGDIVGTPEDDEDDTFGVPESECSLLATDEGTIEIQRAVFKGDPADRENVVIQADDGDNITKQNLLTQSKRKRKPPSNIYVGNYREWKTKLSDQFSTLSDDEVSVLFCFLCSDSGPPDFTDTEWLDLLNGIRHIVYHKENPVTREEAQQTLDRLKSRDYLWEDQDKIKKDTKHETMHRIASINSNIPFYYSSYDTASVYLRSYGYIIYRKLGEKCVRSSGCDDLLILRLQMNILTHITMEDTIIYDKIHRILNVSNQILKESGDKRKEFLMDLRREGEAVHYRGRSHDSADNVTWLWTHWLEARPDIVRSCIGLHPHNDIYIIDNKPYKKSSEQHYYSSHVRCLLYCLLLVEKYQVNLNEQSHRIMMDKIRDRYFPDLTDDGLVDLPDAITETRDDVITFISDDIRHDVMYAFVTECLLEDSDLEFFLTTASPDMISEYCRSWDYKRSEDERCLYVPETPEKMYDLFIDKLQLDIITHCTVSDKGIHESISKKLNIPEEILKWNLSARQRFVESLRDGKVKMFRARGMIVGCAGAGKTTLLRKLQRRDTEDNQPTDTTVGLEVHEDLFEIKDGTLYDYSDEGSFPVPRFLKHDTEEDSMVISGILHHSSRGTKLISMTDFAGQVAYYACHQVYLSRRAFYIVVIDMSKGLDEEVNKYHTDRHKPQGSLFYSWKYKDYFHFWLQSIQTYCDDGKSDTNHESSFHPVILVASHADKVGTRLTKDFYEELETSLSDEQSLRQLISPKRYFKVRCPPNKLFFGFGKKANQMETIERIRKCIAETVEKMPQWGEEIPLKWANLEKVLSKKKQNKRRLVMKNQLKEIKDEDLPSDKDLEDGLRFLHEIGQIIYFADEKMKNVIIVDVQWFVDAFKYIITDEAHLGRESSKNILFTTGRITDVELEETWRDTGDDSYKQHKDHILPYMDKLGLMTKVEGDLSCPTFYIPSMNRTDVPDSCKNKIKDGEKTSILVFHFKTYLPHFFFFRLVVYCLKKWEALDKKLYKNVAFYKTENSSHYFVTAVNKTSIQLQVFTPKGMNLQTECVTGIRKEVEGLIYEITQTFHKQSKYEMGFTCQEINITDEDEEFFMSENEVIKVETRSYKDQRPCPKHAFENIHPFDKNGILRFWLEEDIYSPSNGH